WVDIPDLWPQPRVFEEHRSDAPQRIAALDGVGLRRVRIDDVAGRRGRCGGLLSLGRQTGESGIGRRLVLVQTGLTRGLSRGRGGRRGLVGVTVPPGGATG